MTLSIVYNRGDSNRKTLFELSKDGIDLYKSIVKENTGLNVNPDKYMTGVLRDNPFLVEVVQRLGVKANTNRSSLNIKNIPAELAECYYITNIDGVETIKYNINNWISSKLCNININELDLEQAKDILINIKDLNLLIDNMK